MSNIRIYGPENPNLRCCCCRIHVLTGGKIAALLLTMQHLINLGGSLVPLVIFDHPWSFIVAVFSLSVIALLWYGLLREKDNYMIPFIVCFMVYLVLWSLFTIAIVIAVPILIAEDYHLTKPDEPFAPFTFLDTICGSLSCSFEHSSKTLLTLLLLVVLAILTLLISFWIFYVIVRAYRFIKSKNEGESIMIVSLTHSPTKV